MYDIGEAFSVGKWPESSEGVSQSCLILTMDVSTGSVLARGLGVEW